MMLHSPGSKRTPTYELAEIQACVRAGQYVATASALRGAMALQFDTHDIRECILQLTARDFYKSMRAEQEPARAAGLWQDVYRPWYLGVRLYVKVQIAQAGSVVVISFKEQ